MITCEKCKAEYEEGEEHTCPEPKKKKVTPPIQTEKIITREVIPQDMIEKHSALEKVVEGLKAVISNSTKSKHRNYVTMLGKFLYRERS